MTDHADILQCCSHGDGWSGGSGGGCGFNDVFLRGVVRLRRGRFLYWSNIDLYSSSSELLKEDHVRLNMREV